MKSEKYIVLLENQDSKSLKSVEKEFQLKLTSSEFLSKDNRSFDLIDDKNGVLYKNLNVMVVDKMDEDQLMSAVNDGSNPIIHFEKERTFYIDGALEIVKSLQVSVSEMAQKLLELETELKKKVKKPSKVTTDFEWGLKAVGLDTTQLTGKGVDLCILDTGFDVTHPDFLGRTIEGKSFISGEAWDIDLKGHGTHCAGTAAGNVRLDTGKRYGIAKNANLKIAKALANDGSGTTSSIVDAIDWAISKKVRVISMSLSAPVQLNEAPSPIFEMVGKKALDNNCLLIAAAGNDSQRPALPQPVSIPANSESIMAVGAIDGQMRVATFSNGGLNAATGGVINVCAPGVDVLSSFPKSLVVEGYMLKNGTSMATPHVAGIVALYMEKYPHLTALEIWEVLEKNARLLEGLKYRDVGNGLVQIKD